MIQSNGKYFYSYSNIQNHYLVESAIPGVRKSDVSAQSQKTNVVHANNGHIQCLWLIHIISPFL